MVPRCKHTTVFSKFLTVSFRFTLWITNGTLEEIFIHRIRLFIYFEKRRVEVHHSVVMVNDEEVVGISDTLRVASKKKDVDIIESSLKRGANVNAVNLDGFTSLHGPTSDGSLEIIKCMPCEKNTDIHALDKLGQIPLHSIETRDIDGNTPLNIAVRNRDVKTVRFLLEHGANVNAAGEYGSTPLHQASLETMRILLDNGANVDALNSFNNTPLHHTIYSGCLESIRILLEYGADPNRINGNDDTPLDSAVWFSQVNTVKFLLEHGADVNTGYKRMSTLHSAVTQGKQEIIRILLDNGANVDALTKLDQTPLRMATEEGNLGVIETLLEHGADVNTRDRGGITPLDIAVSNSNVEAVRFLLDHGANVNAADIRGRTPLHRAVVVGSHEIIRILLDKKANVNVYDKWDRTPLIWAFGIPENAGYNDMEEIIMEYGGEHYRYPSIPHGLSLCKGTCKILVEHGADVDATRGFKKTPLHYAVENFDLELVMILLAGGSDINISDKDGNTG